MTKQTSKTSQSKKKSSKPNLNSIPKVVGFPNFNNSSPFPPMMHKKLQYSSNNTLSSYSTAGITGTEQIFNLNSLFDPDATGVGHQPYGFDQLCSSTGPYYKYKVLRAHVTCEFTNPSDSVARLYAFVALRNDVSNSSSLTNVSMNLISERSMATSKYIPTTGSQKAVFNLNIPIAGALNQNLLEFNSDVNNTASVYSSNPVWLAQLKLAIGEASQDSATSVNVKTTIQFDAVFFDRLPLASS
jgi:hypothetical protein